jgi:hypothetical protein
MLLPKECPHCGSSPDCIYAELREPGGFPTGMVLCFDCMRVLSVVDLCEVRDCVRNKFIEQAVLEHNTNCLERRD